MQRERFRQCILFHPIVVRGITPYLSSYHLDTTVVHSSRTYAVRHRGCNTAESNKRERAQLISDNWISTFKFRRQSAVDKKVCLRRNVEIFVASPDRNAHGNSCLLSHKVQRRSERRR